MIFYTIFGTEKQVSYYHNLFIRTLSNLITVYNSIFHPKNIVKPQTTTQSACKFTIKHKQHERKWKKKPQKSTSKTTKHFPAVDRYSNFPYTHWPYGSASHFLINRKTNKRLLCACISIIYKRKIRTHNHRKYTRYIYTYVCGKHKLLIEFSAQNYTLFVSAHMLKRKYCSAATHIANESETTWPIPSIIITQCPPKRCFPISILQRKPSWYYVYIWRVNSGNVWLYYTLRTQSVYRFSNVLE